MRKIHVGFNMITKLSNLGRVLDCCPESMCLPLGGEPDDPE